MEKRFFVKGLRNSPGPIETASGRFADWYWGPAETEMDALASPPGYDGGVFLPDAPMFDMRDESVPPGA